MDVHQWAKEGCHALWFWKGSAVVGRKPPRAMGQFGRITGLKDLPSRALLWSYIRKAVSHSIPGT
jgi:hypothetical protein